MGTSRSKQLKKAGKQLGSTIDRFDLDKRALGLADKAGVATRKKRLGIPLGRKRPAWGRIATYGAAAAAGMMSSRALTRDDDGHGDVEAAAERGAQRGATSSARDSGSARDDEDASESRGGAVRAARRAARAAWDAGRRGDRAG